MKGVLYFDRKKFLHFDIIGFQFKNRKYKRSGVTMYFSLTKPKKCASEG
jgi:hypothetical protein